MNSGPRQKRRTGFQASIFFTGTPATDELGLGQIEAWGGGKTDDFVFLETSLVLETGWKNRVKTQ